MDLQLEETDSLAGLEERILRAVELVSRLKEENSDLKRRLAAAEDSTLEALEAQSKAENTLAEVQTESEKVAKELESLHAERQQVKSRIEKLLGQMDLLSAS